MMSNEPEDPRIGVGSRGITQTEFEEALAHYDPPPSEPGGTATMPSHYERFRIEPIYFIEENELTPLEGKVVKYTVRSRFKHDDGGIQDLRKAARCIEMLIAKRMGMEDWWKLPEHRKESIDG